MTTVASTKIFFSINDYFTSVEDGMFCQVFIYLFVCLMG